MIKAELERLDAVGAVSVTETGAVDDQSCAWTVTFDEASGNLNELQVIVSGVA